MLCVFKRILQGSLLALTFPVILVASEAPVPGPGRCFEFIQKVRANIQGEGDARIFDRLARALEHSSWEQVDVYLATVLHHDLFVNAASFEKVVRAHFEFIQDPDAPQALRSKAFLRLIDAVEAPILGERILNEDLHPHLKALYDTVGEIVQNELTTPGVQLLSDEALSSLYTTLRQQMLGSKVLQAKESVSIQNILSSGLLGWKLAQEPAEIKFWLDAALDSSQSGIRAAGVLREMPKVLAHVLTSSSLEGSARPRDLAKRLGAELDSYYFDMLSEALVLFDRALNDLDSSVSKVGDEITQVFREWGGEDSVKDFQNQEDENLDSEKLDSGVDEEGLVGWKQYVERSFQFSELFLDFYLEVLEEINLKIRPQEGMDEVALSDKQEQLTQKLYKIESEIEGMKVLSWNLGGLKTSVMDTLQVLDHFRSNLAIENVDAELVNIHLDQILTLRVRALKHHRSASAASSLQDWQKQSDASDFKFFVEDELEGALLYLDDVFLASDSVSVRAAILDYLESLGETFEVIADLINRTKVDQRSNRALHKEKEEMAALVDLGRSLVDLFPGFELRLHLQLPELRDTFDQHKVRLQEQGLSFNYLPIETQGKLFSSRSAQEVNEILKIYNRSYFPLLEGLLEESLLNQIGSDRLDDLELHLNSLEKRLQEVAEVEVKLLLNLKNNSLPVEVRAASLQPLYAIWSWREEVIHLLGHQHEKLESTAFEPLPRILETSRIQAEKEQLQLLEYMLLGRVQSGKQLQQRQELLTNLFAEIKLSEKGALQQWLAEISSKHVQELWQVDGEDHIENYKLLLDRLRSKKN